VTKDDLEAFLWYGYSPKYFALPAAMIGRRLGDEGVCDKSLADLVLAGAEVWRRAIESCLTLNTRDIVIPLSGGLDSRAILSGVLEHISPHSVHTYTFGIPGTYDYEIGNSVASIAGTRHCAFDLNRYRYSFDNLLDISCRVDGRTVLFQHAPSTLLETEYNPISVAFWTGFMGDPVAGSHLLKKDSTTWEQAGLHFAERNRFCRSMDLVHPGFLASRYLPKVPLVDGRVLCYDEQIDYGVRQECYIKPLVLLQGYEYRTPFLHPEWVGFILSVPRRYRQGQYLYREILKAAFPKLFSLPTKNNFGLCLAAPRWRQELCKNKLRLRAAAKRLTPWIDWGISPSINYIDFDRGLRERPDLKAVVYESIQDLKKRQIVDWIDMDSIWERHRRRRADHADALTLLASLEINLKSQEMQPG